MAIDDKSAEVSEGDPEALVPELESLLTFAERLQDKIDLYQGIIFAGRTLVVGALIGLIILGLLGFMPNVLSNWENEKIQNVFYRYWLWPLLLLVFLAALLYLAFQILIALIYFKLLLDRDRSSRNRIINALRGLLPALTNEPHMTMLKRTGIEWGAAVLIAR